MSTQNDWEVWRVYRMNKELIAASDYGGYYEVNRREFELWSDAEQKREWIEVHSDHGGEPVEQTGITPWRLYYEEPSSFYKDIREYIILKKIPLIKS